MTFGRKSRILAPGDRKKHQETIAYRHIGEPGRDKSLLGPKIERSDFRDNFRSESRFPAKFRKIRLFRTHARATAANPL